MNGPFSARATLLVRADASTTMGTGHVMRCLALSQAWVAGGGRVCFMGAMPPALHARVASEGFEVVAAVGEAGGEADAHATAALARKRHAVAVVVDGYHFGGEFESVVGADERRVLAVDDCGRSDRIRSDFLLNQNIHAAPALYPEREGVELLLGTRYALLRSEFHPWRTWTREHAPVARRLLVTMGGGDADNVTRRVVEAIGDLAGEELETVVVVGGSSPHLESVAAAAAALPRPAVVRRDVRDMPALMGWADLAIAAGGSTCWELAVLGLPAVLVVLADNQRPIAAGLDVAGAAVDLGPAAGVSPARLAATIRDLIHDPSRRAAMGAAARGLVDGFGAERVVAAIGRTARE